MRSTIILDPDVQRLTEVAMSRNNASFNQLINVAICKGLNEPHRATA
jgi:hypothetical protein